MEIGQVISSHMTDVFPLCKKKKSFGSITFSTQKSKQTKNNAISF